MFTRPRAFNDPFDSWPSFDYLWDPGYHPNQTGWHVRIMQGIHQWYARIGNVRKITDNVVALSLSARRASPVMWAHYARSHSGLALGFDSKHDWFSRGSERELVAVRYSQYRPRRRIISELTIEEVFSTKSTEWAYEQEWRLLDGTAASVAEPFPHVPDCFPFELDPSALREVILGCRANSALYRRVCRLLAYEPYRHVQMFTTHLSERTFGVSFKRVRVTRHRKPPSSAKKERRHRTLGKGSAEEP
jgi:hypothetical protein